MVACRLLAAFDSRIVTPARMPFPEIFWLMTRAMISQSPMTGIETTRNPSEVVFWPSVPLPVMLNKSLPPAPAA